MALHSIAGNMFLLREDNHPQWDVWLQNRRFCSWCLRIQTWEVLWTWLYAHQSLQLRWPLSVGVRRHDFYKSRYEKETRSVVSLHAGVPATRKERRSKASREENGERERKNQTQTQSVERLTPHYPSAIPLHSLLLFYIFNIRIFSVKSTSADAMFVSSE